MSPDVHEPPRRRRTRLGLAALLGGAAVAHVVWPRPFEAMVPEWVPGTARTWNLASAAAEGVSAGLLVSRSTSHLGGWAAAGTFGVVGVANVQAVADGGMSALPGWLSTRSAAVLRLPLQVPLIWWACQVARRPAPRG